MNTTSSPSRSTALKLASAASQSSRASLRRACSRSSAVSAANVVASSCSGITPAERRIAFRNQRMPNSKSSIPIASCNRCSGTRSSKGPSATTMRASTRRPANAPSPAGRQPRTVATASTIVSASTASTNEARNAVVIAGPMCAKLSVMRTIRLADRTIASRAEANAEVKNRKSNRLFPIKTNLSCGNTIWRKQELGIRTRHPTSCRQRHQAGIHWRRRLGNDSAATSHG